MEIHADDIAAFKADNLLQANLRSFDRILSFFGLSMTKEGQVVQGSNFTARVPDVWECPNHNWLRIIRVLRSLTLLGLEIEAQAFFALLEEMYTRRKFPIPADTFRYWTEAVEKGCDRAN